MSGNHTTEQNEIPDFFTFTQDEKGNTSVDYKLPLSFTFGVNFKDDELFYQLGEEIKVNISILADWIIGEAQELASNSDNNYYVGRVSAMFELTARFIGGYAQMLEMLMNNREEIRAIKLRGENE